MSEKTIDFTGDFTGKVAAIILAGGQGTRLYPLTSSRCKPSVLFGGRYRLIDIPLSNSLNCQINQIFVISQYFAGELHRHILSTYNEDLFQSGRLHLITPEKTRRGELFKGTADAVRQALDSILESSAEWFFILSGDQLYNMDLHALLSFARDKGADLTIASLSVQKEEATRMGLLKIDENNGISAFVEKPTDPNVLALFEEEGTYLASMGIYVFKREALISLLSEEGDDFGHDLIPKQLKKGKSFSFVYGGYWEDIGTVSSYYKANLLLTERKGLTFYHEGNQIISAQTQIPSSHIRGTAITDSVIGQGGIIEAEEIRGSVIGTRALIKQGTKIYESIIAGNRSYHPFFSKENPSREHFSIGENCTIHKAIIDEDCRIGNNVQLINKEGLTTYDGDGIFIRDGIIIVASGTEIPDNFVL